MILKHLKFVFTLIFILCLSFGYAQEEKKKKASNKIQNLLKQRKKKKNQTKSVQVEQINIPIEDYKIEPLDALMKLRWVCPYYHTISYDQVHGLPENLESDVLGKICVSNPSSDTAYIRIIFYKLSSGKISKIEKYKLLPQGIFMHLFHMPSDDEPFEGYIEIHSTSPNVYPSGYFLDLWQHGIGAFFPAQWHRTDH